MLLEAEAGGVDLDGGGDDAGGLFGVAGEDGVVCEGHVGIGGLGIEGGGGGEALELFAGGNGALEAVLALLAAHPRHPVVDGVFAGAHAVFGGGVVGEDGPGDAFGLLVGLPALRLGEGGVPAVGPAFAVSHWRALA